MAPLRAACLLLCFTLAHLTGWAQEKHAPPADPHDTALEDNRFPYSFYLYLTAEIEATPREIVVETAWLSLYLKEERGYDERTYRQYMKRLLHRKDTLQLQKKAADYPEIHILSPCHEIEQTAKHGLAALTAKYLFKPGKVLLINPRSDQNNEYFTIKELFKLNRFVQRDDESGYLMVYPPKTQQQLQEYREHNRQDSILRARH